MVVAGAAGDQELLWGLRGGGGNFGVVTRLKFSLHPIGQTVLAGTVTHPRAAARALTRFYRDFMVAAADEVCGGLIFREAPVESTQSRGTRGAPLVVLLVLYVGEARDGATALRPLLEWGNPIASEVSEIPYATLQRAADPYSPRGARSYFKVGFLRKLSDDAIEAVLDHVSETPSPLTQVLLEPLGGAVARTDQRSMALSTPEAPWAYHCLSAWKTAAEDEHNISWTRLFAAALERWTTGAAYPNFQTADEGEARLRAAYGLEKFDRLVSLKRRLDPKNLFSLNANIKPFRR
jgi:FAD/FMN-containing dehydrogenase